MGDVPPMFVRCSRIGERMSDRLDHLIEAANKSGLTIDFLEVITHGLSRQAFLKVIGNASSLPSYMKSIDSPYFFRSAKAPSRESR